MEITKTVISENHISYTVTNPSKRLLAMVRLLEMKKSKRRKEIMAKHLKSKNHD